MTGAAAQGETWSVDANGERYQRWWGEDHFGNGWVRKHGNSNTGRPHDRTRVVTQICHRPASGSVLPTDWDA